MNQITPSRARLAMYAVVFVCGGCVMILELVGSRLLAPYVGTSIYVWTSLIGVILGCLSIGYWWGGAIADRKPEMVILSRIIFLAGVLVSLIALAGDPILVLMQTLIADIRINSTLATLLLFGPASILLGMVAPFAVRLSLLRIEETGATAGRLYAVSTVGSIAGTFLAGFVLLSYFGHRSVLFGLSLVLILLSLLLRPGSSRSLKIAIFVLIAGLSFTKPFVNWVMGPGFVEEHSAYNRIWIFDGYQGEYPLRAMQLNDSLDSVKLMDTDKMFFDYTKYFDLAARLHPNPERALLIGGGAYIYPMHFLGIFPKASMDAVEIDPKLTEIAREYFEFEETSRLAIYHEDGRTFLNGNESAYDAIFCDAYKSYSVPFQLATREAMELMSARLTPNGVVAFNVIASAAGENGRFLRALVATIETAFPKVLVFAVDDPTDAGLIQNFSVIAFKNATAATPLLLNDGQSSALLAHQWPGELPRDMPVLQDAFAPVEHYVKNMIVHHRELRSSLVQTRFMDKVGVD